MEREQYIPIYMWPFWGIKKEARTTLDYGVYDTHNEDWLAFATTMENAAFIAECLNHCAAEDEVTMELTKRANEV